MDDAIERLEQIMEKHGFEPIPLGLPWPEAMRLIVEFIEFLDAEHSCDD